MRVTEEAAKHENAAAPRGPEPDGPRPDLFAPKSLAAQRLPFPLPQWGEGGWGEKGLFRNLAGIGRRELGLREASLVLMVSYFASAILGAVRQLLLNRQFGADETAGAYYAAARLPEILFTLVAGGALSSAFIPVLIGTRRTDGEEAARRLTSLVLTSLLLVLTVAVVARADRRPVGGQRTACAGLFR